MKKEVIQKTRNSQQFVLYKYILTPSEKEIFVNSGDILAKSLVAEAGEFVLYKLNELPDLEARFPVTN